MLSWHTVVHIFIIPFTPTSSFSVYWDCDCRPSDGCFLSIKCNAPLFVHETVWDTASKLVLDSTVHAMLQESRKLESQQPSTSAQQPPSEVQSSASSKDILQQANNAAAVSAASQDSKQQTLTASDYLILM